jgi:hypothetical protein
MRHDPRQLGRDNAENLTALRDLDSEQSLRTERERDVVADRVEIIFAIGPADYLVVLPILADLLESAVEITDVGNATDDRFSIELEHQSQNTMRSRVLWPDVDEHVLTLEIRLETRRRLESDRGAAIVRHERNALRPPLRVETRCRELYFDGAL